MEQISNPETIEFGKSGVDSHESFKTDKGAFDAYATMLQISAESLKDKVVLDLGAGSGQFAKYVNENNLAKKVISLERQAGLLRDSDGSVRGTAEQLPFAADSFDMVVSHCAFPNVAERGKIPVVFGEVRRVLKDGGEARLSPVFFWRGHDEHLRGSLDELRRDGGMDIEKIRLEDQDLYVVDKSGKQTGSLLAEAYLLVLKADKSAK